MQRDPAAERGTPDGGELEGVAKGPGWSRFRDRSEGGEGMTKTSVGIQELRERIGEKAKAEPGHRFWGLYTHVWKLDVLREAYRLTKLRNGAPGVDGVTFAQIEAQGVEDLLAQLSEELRTKSYRPLPCRQVNIPKEGGKTRGLKIPAIRDRVVQGAVRLIQEPIFEADFQPGSFGYRPKRKPHQALDRVRTPAPSHRLGPEELLRHGEAPYPLVEAGKADPGRRHAVAVQEHPESGGQTRAGQIAVPDVVRALGPPSAERLRGAAGRSQPGSGPGR